MKQDYIAAKYRDKEWAVFCISNQTFHFLAKGKKANEARAKGLNEYMHKRDLEDSAENA